jgi:hypothetical protein
MCWPYSRPNEGERDREREGERSQEKGEKEKRDFFTPEVDVLAIVYSPQ